MTVRTKSKVGALVIASVAIMIVAGLRLGQADARETTGDTEPPTTSLPTAEVSRSDLVEQKDAVGTVTHGDSWPAPIDAEGVVTARNDKDSVVESGEPLIWIDNRPVTLATGTTPMYRTLELVGSNASKHLRGPDITQLQQFLIDAGHDDKGRLEADGIFGTATRNAVKSWQKATDLAVTGRVDRSQIVFHADALRIESEARVGSRFQELLVTDGTQVVKADFDNKSRPFLTQGATVVLDPDGQQLTGTIVDVETGINESDGSQVLTATIEPDQPLPTGTEKINVVATRTLATDVLVVPVRAVLALAGGGYGLEVKTPQGAELKAVELGAIVDDVVEVTGDIAEGDQVLVPNDRFGADE